jgi:hypothetical protein
MLVVVGFGSVFKISHVLNRDERAVHNCTRGRATSGVQSRELVGAIDVHQPTTTTTGRSAASSPPRNGRSRITKSKLAEATAAPIVTANRREFDPSNHRASALHETPTTTETDSSVAIEGNPRSIINEFRHAHFAS